MNALLITAIILSQPPDCPCGVACPCVTSQVAAIPQVPGLPQAPPIEARVSNLEVENNALKARVAALESKVLGVPNMMKGVRSTGHEERYLAFLESVKNSPSIQHVLVIGVDAPKEYTSIEVFPSGFMGIANGVYDCSVLRDGKVYITKRPTVMQSAPKSTPQFKKSGFSGHTHTCANGHTWDHSMDGGSHRCPYCGLYQNVVDTGMRGTTSAQPTQTFAPVRNTFQNFRQVFGSGCANGNCGR